MIKRALCFTLAICAGCESSDTVRVPTQTWGIQQYPSEIEARHEAAFAAVDSQIYLMGGRGMKPVNIFDTRSRAWSTGAVPPIEIHHFQAVTLNNTIYVVGAFTGKYPGETPVDRVLTYSPDEDRFEFTHVIPKERRRGAAGAVVYNNKIYVVGGIVDGHRSGFQPWLDEYDPETGEWRVLPDAPHARDHFAAAVLQDQLFAIGGRTSSQATGQVFDLTVKPSDVFDFASNQWLPPSSVRDIPTPRAGTMAAVIGDLVVVGGGESGTQGVAHNEVEAFQPELQQWFSWPSLQRGRHGTGFVVIDNAVYTASGSGNRGGQPELNSMEILEIHSD